MLANDVVLSVNNICKKYYKNENKLFERKKEEDSFWALQNINFEIRRGEIVGIIGPNGAGKSTLLKLLADIIPPTSGYIEYEGSIQSILEVGTGFHPDLSGYENIFLNASILGMKKEETLKKVEEIIEFSGIKEFIKEPIKHYSSGMYLRLALSVALFTENDILLLDEVVSVGDAEFRQKAIRKIKELALKGKTCIMISHDLNSVLSLCEHCIFMEKGEIAFIGKSRDTIQEYIDLITQTTKKNTAVSFEHEKCKFIGITSEKENYLLDEPIKLKITYEKFVNEDIDIVLKIRSLGNLILSDCEIYRPDYKEKLLAPGIYQTLCVIPANLFNNGNFSVDVILGDKVSSLVEIQSAITFTTQLKDWEINKKWNESNENIPFRPICTWATKRLDSAANN